MSFGILQSLKDLMKLFKFTSIVPTEPPPSLLSRIIMSAAQCFSRIFQIPKLGTNLKQDSIPLSYTPRKFIPHPSNHYLYMIEGDHRVHGDEAAAKKLDELVRFIVVSC